MARKKDKKPPITNGLEPEYIVEKSRPLMLMKEVPFALGELKVLDTYLSRINARDPDATTVRFSKEEYEDLMGIERMRPERLEKYVKSIMSKTVTLPDPAARGGWRVYTLFDEAVCAQDENEQWWIDLSCTTKAKKIFFNLDSIGYIRYQLKNVLPLSSKYSVLLYVYLLDNRFRGSWDVSLPELREAIFRCKSKFYAENFKNFRQDILEKSIKEVNAKTDLTFAYEPVKTGRKVSGIKFKLIKDEVSLPLEQDPAQVSLFEHDDLFDDRYDMDDPLGIYAEALPPEFTPEEVEALRALAVDHVPFELDGPLPMECKVADYLQHKVNLMNAQRHPVKDKFAWLRRAVAEDWR